MALPIGIFGNQNRQFHGKKYPNLNIRVKILNQDVTNIFGFLTAVKNFAKLVLSFAPNLLIPYTVKPMKRPKTSGVNAKFSTVGVVFYTILLIYLLFIYFFSVHVTL